MPWHGFFRRTSDKEDQIQPIRNQLLDRHDLYAVTVNEVQFREGLSNKSLRRGQIYDTIALDKGKVLDHIRIV